MYYLEEIINGVLCCKTTPHGEFIALTSEQLTIKLQLVKYEKIKLIEALERIEKVYDWQEDDAGKIAHEILQSID